ncbi:glutamate racemase [Anaerosporobacter faecicola]|uniref:glutamate racemase n=1 Tax=Anaerosporobacter faecicola TaxID=2718714 RepID=UPI00143C1467|nr:glutamate racemase [Anaerosporobacter faecicola]
MKIGVFDSGFGGLSVLHNARKRLPNADFIYYADKEHVPYGEKEPEQVKAFITDIFSFLQEKEVDAIVIACNTATSLLDKEYRKSFGIPIVGMEPAVKKAIDLYEDEKKQILVAATPITIHGDKLQKLVTQVDAEGETELLALPGLVTFAEQGIFQSPAVLSYLQTALQEYDLTAVGTIVLGCTHFNYFKEAFQQIFSHPVHFVDGNTGTINQLIHLLPCSSDPTHLGTVDYYFSGRPVTSQEMLQIEACMKQLDFVYTIE